VARQSLYNASRVHRRLQSEPYAVPPLFFRSLFRLAQDKTILIAGDPTSQDTQVNGGGLGRQVNARFLPNTILLPPIADRATATWVLVAVYRGAPRIRGASDAYVCETRFGKLPTTDPK